MKIKITIEAESQPEAYMAVNKLANNYKIVKVEADKKTWIFSDNSKVKFLFKREFQDDSGAIVKIK
jgi:hypothetical protein